jgi:uncharacterized membrane protein YphA (DoxX/SURF4 family)
MIDQITKAGRWLFPLSFLLYVALHFGKADMGASFLPLWVPFPIFWDYFTGICIMAFIVSCLIGKYDKLATVLMAFYVFLTIFFIHIPRAATSLNDMLNIFRNIMVIGGLLVYAKYATKDERIIG